MFLAATFL